MHVIFTDSQKMRWLKKLQNTQKIKDAELAAEMITHSRDGTLDEKAVAYALKNMAINK